MLVNFGEISVEEAPITPLMEGIERIEFLRVYWERMTFGNTLSVTHNVDVSVCTICTCSGSQHALDILRQRFSTFSDSRTTWQILSRFADHQRNFYIFLGKILNFWRPFLVIFPKFVLGLRTTKKNFANFPNFLAFFRVKDRKIIPIPICNLVVTQSMKRRSS